MTTYFYGSPEIQAAAPPPEGIQTLYLMNPNYLSYPDTPQQQTSNILFFNPPSNALNPTSIPHAPPQNHPLLGVPLPSANSDDPSRHHGIGILNFQNNMWGSLDQSSAGIGSTVVSVAGQDVRSQTQQGLSLSLSSRQRSIGGEHEIQQHAHGTGGDDMRVWRELSPPSVSVASNGIFGSKYLRVIQELLDEVVNIGKEIKTSSDPTEVANKESVAQDGSTAAAAGGGDGNSKRAQELTTAQRQELQMKKAKLVSMIDEVEQRYKQYHHQMQLVVSSFEQAAGLGSAKSYTALALQTISKQFRCLKDAISSQIKATNESLGDEDCSGVKIEGSRLKYVDHHLRQQRAIQQLGMMQHNPWRPQRGLPERAVSVLRAWLFEHFLHPYPKDSDKVILAKQAGLTRSQVSNWFINARVRLWKPMVEEMYVEEMKEQEKNGSANHASASNNEQHNKHGSTSNTESSLGAKARQSEPEKLKISQNPNSSPSEFSNSTISTPHVGGPIQPQQGFNIIRSAELEGTSQFSTLKKRPRSNDTMHNSPSSFSLVTNATTDHGGGGFGAYFSPEQLGPRFKGNGNVSLTLGLGENLSFSTNQHNFMSGQNIQLGRLDIGNGITSGTDFCGINNNSQNSHSGTAGLEDIEVQNRKRFVAQLLPDFVA